MIRPFKEQFIPLTLTGVTFLFLCAFFYGFILLLNFLPTQEKIELAIRKRDILVGLTIYLKTSIDFAIFIGNMMRSNPGWKKRIAIEIGTAFGNAMGTLVVLVIWNFFREIPLLMAIMIFIASLVLLQMANESLNELLRAMPPLKRLLVALSSILTKTDFIIEKIFGKFIPNVKIANAKPLRFFPLILFSFTIPFILGLDDFAGYIPLFSIINVFGFAIGVFLGHMLLTAALFIHPAKTTAIVRHPVVLFIGTVAFVAIAFFGFLEVFRLVISLVH